MKAASVVSTGAVLFLMIVALPSHGLAEQTSAADSSYRIGPGDKIRISVLDVPDFGRELYVSNSGRIHVPRLGVMTVVDETADGLAARIARGLVDHELVTDPVVNVDIIEYRSKPVYVMGEVLSPGQFIINEQMYLTDLIGIANGLAEGAASVGFLYRRHSNDNDAVADQPPDDGTVDSIVDDVTVIDLDQLYTDPSLNIEMRGGDMFYIPVRTVEYFYVIGDVYQPGRHELPPTNQGFAYSVRALGMAGGPLKTAKLAKSVLVSRNQEGEVSFREVNLKDIFAGKQDDFIIKPGEILFVPGSTAKTLGYGLLNALPGMTFAY